MLKVDGYFHRVLLCAAGFFGSFFKRSVVATKIEKRRVLVIIPHDKSWWAINVVQQFVATLRVRMGYAASPDIDVVSLQDSQEALGTLLLGDGRGSCYDLVMTVGSWASREVRDYLDTASNPIPHIFCGVFDPLALGIVDSYELPGRPVTGVAAIPIDFDLTIDMLRALLPDLRAIALVGGSTPNDPLMTAIVHRQVTVFSQACAARGMALVILAQPAPEEIVEVLARARREQQIGVVCAVNDIFVSEYMEKLIEGCKAVGVPLCTSELSSVYHGAAIGVGAHGGLYGVHGAALAHEILVQRRRASSLPVVLPPVEQAMRYNYEALLAQGVTLTPAACHLLNMVSVFFNAEQ